ncbi:hypothetical protein MKZ38_007388 [Zalerion maritima]|uniref:N-acetylgalactosaminide beta-1,3-galactosyltransferase n=1 Tax=Zalerion maritima TaxID=339359 RepID=A0AAD5WN99_9PEZI|nr:hypothetical protein MKZ38_007388 [Zalerion maritima]
MHVCLITRRSRFGVFAVALTFCVLLLVYWRQPGGVLENTNFHIPLGKSSDGDTTKDGAKTGSPPDFGTTSRFRPVSFPKDKKATDDELCASFPSHLLQSVQPVLKVGHYDVMKKDLLTAQLDGPSRCFSPDELLVFSDLDDNFGKHEVVDVLATLPEQYRNTADNTKWQNYERMRELRAEGLLDIDHEATKNISGWSLDKFKFLAIVEQAWERKPGRDWYVFYETDTYVFWDNMFRFLGNLDPETPMYMGSPSPGREDPVRLKHEKSKVTWFANGGPGYVISRAAMRKLLDREVGPNGRYATGSLTERWYKIARDDCCGDSVVGWALWNNDVPVSGYWPLFNPHSLHGVPYYDSQWCQPVLTLHKSRPDAVTDLWRWEHQVRTPHRPLVYRDLYEFGLSDVPAQKENWDNGAWASFKPQSRVNSLGMCEKECEVAKKCVQYRWKEGAETGCLLMREVTLGVAKEPQEVEGKKEDGVKEQENHERDGETKVRYTSGWMLDRIGRWKKERPCSKVDWVPPSIKRIF